MKKVINYFFYGYYQIDYLFGVRSYRSHVLGTGAVLFDLSISLYVYSALLLIIGGIVGYSNYFSSTYNWLTFVMTILIVNSWLFYWMDKKKYEDDFNELDKDSPTMRWICFIYAVAFSGGGIFCLYGCSRLIRLMSGWGLDNM
jgi:hypothetical protein